ncbi:hypothetical protein CLV99_2824 [Sphingobacterium yanglingense]|uniref:Uncharacterized protein n=1 Tax=Sphingobacterium yanglingense TaxID=1437280 RepID=A0A4R6WCU1_9SPHI|nr:hypothetical protein CLV99_2824 [Sphingobacterium yanglingense]
MSDIDKKYAIQIQSKLQPKKAKLFRLNMI